MFKNLKKLLILGLFLFVFLTSCTTVPEAGSRDDIEWLKDRSMLLKAEEKDNEKYNIKNKNTCGTYLNKGVKEKQEKHRDKQNEKSALFNYVF